MFEYASPYIQVYDPANDSWSVPSLSPMYGVSAAFGATTGVDAPKRVYFFDENRTDVFDPANNSWTSGAVMPTGRFIARTMRLLTISFML